MRIKGKACHGALLVLVELLIYTYKASLSYAVSKGRRK
jgi:hypothetical protein